MTPRERIKEIQHRLAVLAYTLTLINRRQTRMGIDEACEEIKALHVEARAIFKKGMKS
jgi:hypothetical protein